MRKAFLVLALFAAATLAAPAAPQLAPLKTIDTDTGLPATPQLTSIAVDSVANRIYVGDNSENALVHVIDGTTNDLLGTISVDGPVTCLKVNETTRKLYVGTDLTYQVKVYDLDWEYFGVDIDLYGHRPTDMALDEGTNMLYVAAELQEMMTIDGNGDYLSGQTSYGRALDAIDVDAVGGRIVAGSISDKALGTIDIASGNSGWWVGWLSFGDLAMNHSTGILWGANPDEGSISRVDIDDFGNTIQIPAASTPANIAVDQGTDRVFVTFPAEGKVRIYSDLDGWGSGAPTGPAPGAVAFNPSSGMVYVCDSAVGTVSVYSSGGSSIFALTDIFLDSGATPDTVAINSATNTVYVGDMSNGLVYVLDGSTDQYLTAVDVGGPVTAIAALESANKIYVGVDGFAEDFITVIDGQGNYVWTDISVPSPPTDIVFNEADGIAYASTEDAQSVLFIDTTYDYLADSWTYDRPWSSIAFNPVADPGMIYLTSDQPDSFASYDNVVGSGGDLTGFKDFFKIDFNRVSGEVWSTNPASSELSRFDPADILNTIRAYTTSHPGHDVAVNEELNKAYSSVPDAGEVVEASVAADDIVGFHYVGNQPRGIAYNRFSGKIYVAVSDEEKVAVLQDLAASGGLDTTPPTITSVGYNPYVVDKGGDIVGLYVEVKDNVGVASVTADGFPMTLSWGNQWYADLPSSPTADYGHYSFDVVALDAAGNETQQTHSYLIARTYWAPASAFFRPTIHGFWTSNPIGAYGRVTKVTDQWNFEVNDGSSPISLAVNVPLHGLTVGDFVRVSGQLYGNETSPTLYAKPLRLRVDQDVP